ncbi:cytochrome P450 3A24-like [Bradysia coprophila]|uniref:cytochrome P450 3A24-like n=1 Tax=Bradysia coprophila TaxID=38358 RepID=UPI00187DD7B4|nr:cytochrome P450 3A24-like [Bradysia coprophila]
MLILTLAFVLLFVLFYQRQRQLTIFKRLRIPGPEPNFVFGNLIDISREGSHSLFPKWTKEYGPIVGFFFGSRPQLLVSDIELIRHVLIKDFHKFTDRNKLIPGGVHPVPVLQNMIIWANYNAWKNIRAAMTPLFSPSKLNAMEPLMMDSIDKFVTKIGDKANSGEEINLKSLIYEFMFSCATKCVFGLDLKLKHETKNFFEASSPRLDRSILASIMIFFPPLSFIAYPLRVLWEQIRFYMLWSPEGFVYDFTKRIIQNRKVTKIHSFDFLQLLMKTKRIKASGHSDLEMTSEAVKSNNNLMSRGLHGENLSNEEIVTNAMVLLLASYETTAVTFQFCVHNLVNHQNIQDELRTKLRKAVVNGTVSLSTLSEVPLLNRIVMETLRMFPPVSPFLTRVANENYEYQGTVIPKGMPVCIAVSSIHNDPTLWPDPEEFRPARFESSFEKMSFLAFGIGPKNCLGLRFAYMELQLTLAKLILMYRLEPGPSTEKKIETKELYATLSPKNGVFCKVTKLEE